MEITQANFEGTSVIPLLGSVAAGRPLDMYEVDDTVAVPDSLFQGRRVFALRVRGHSMIEAGIHDGDCLVLEPREDADNGRIVVAEIDGAVTVKKLFREAGGRIRLQPANSEMLPLVVPGNHVRVLGVVVGVLRKYGFREPSSRALRGCRPSALRTPLPRTAAVPPSPLAVPDRSALRDDAILDLSLNAIDSYLTRWRVAVEGEKQRGKDEVRMSEMARDLNALREWCGRTRKPGLRRAMLAEANQLMTKMGRFAASRAIELPDPLRDIALPDLTMH